MSPNSSFLKVVDDAFHGVNVKAKVPDGSSGKSISRYATVDGQISIPASGSAVVIMSGSATIPVKAWTFNAKALEEKQLSVTQYKNFTLNSELCTMHTGYKEFAWRNPVCEPGMKHFTRTMEKKASSDLHANAESLAEETSAEMDVNENNGVNNFLNGGQYQYGHINDNVCTFTAQAGYLQDCPQRWRFVAESMKIQNLCVPEKTAGFWKSVDFFPRRSYQTLGAFMPKTSIVLKNFDATTVQNVLQTGISSPVNYDMGDCLVSSSNKIGSESSGDTNIKIGLDLKMIDEMLADVPHFGEKPSYNEGSF